MCLCMKSARYILTYLDYCLFLFILIIYLFLFILFYVFLMLLPLSAAVLLFYVSSSLLSVWFTLHLSSTQIEILQWSDGVQRWE